MRAAIVLGLITMDLIAAAPAIADWRAANPAVEAAARDPSVAAVLRATQAMDAALVAGDTAGFIGWFAADAVINSPFNSVSDRAEAERRSASGLLRYESLSRSIEHASVRANGEVLLMGEETYRPRPPHPLAGRTVRRRTTEIWTRTPEGWRLSVRQATNYDSR
ncbi:MAG: nuclear transport factor 2 family protein [Sphingomonadaceae bacterium]